jgi:uncharacterized protein
MSDYSTHINGGSHWSLRVRKGTTMTLTDTQGNANVGMLFYNPENLLERYNAPDTLKCQHTFKLTRGHCLYSDMGRIFCSIIDDDFGWHETICGNSNAKQVVERWGQRDYQQHSNEWLQNGYDAFLVELVKYGLGRADMASNVNWFSQVTANDEGVLQLETDQNKANSSVTLRFEMDTLVILHTCPHPMNQVDTYPMLGIDIDLGVADVVKSDDYCRNFRPENQRGFENNALYHLGI